MNRAQILPIAPGIRLVKESELSAYVPWSIKKIKRGRATGKIRAFADPLNPKVYIYNLDEVLATIQAGRPAPASNVIPLPENLRIAI